MNDILKIKQLLGELCLIEGPDETLDKMIESFVIDYEMGNHGKSTMALIPNKYTASVDAALALVNRLMPMCSQKLNIRPEFVTFTITPADATDRGCSGKTAPIAILRALLMTLAEKEKAKNI